MLAIVIPYYNINFFENSLLSLKEQSDKRFTVYIGNDASAISPDTIIEKYKNDISVVYRKFEDNLGKRSLVKHWKRCIELVGDEKWILILGDDDVLEKNCVAQFYKHLIKIENYQCNLVRFASQRMDVEGLSQSKIYTHPQLETSYDAFYRVFKEETRSSLSEYIFNKKAYNTHGFQDFPLAWFSDTMAWLDFAEKKNIYSINEATVYIRLSDVSISGKSDNMKEKYKASYLFYKRVIKRHFGGFSRMQQENIFKEFCSYVHVTRSYSWDNWRRIVWNALKKVDLITIKKITKKTINTSENG